MAGGKPASAAAVQTAEWHPSGAVPPPCRWVRLLVGVGGSEVGVDGHGLLVVCAGLVGVAEGPMGVAEAAVRAGLLVAGVGIGGDGEGGGVVGERVSRLVGEVGGFAETVEYPDLALPV